MISDAHKTIGHIRARQRFVFILIGSASIAVCCTALATHSAVSAIFCGLVCGLICALLDRWYLRRHAELVESAWLGVCNGTGSGTYTIDYRSRRLVTSHAFNLMLGFRDEDAPKTLDQWLALIDPAYRGGLQAALDDYRAGRSPSIVCEFRMRRGDGRQQWIKCHAKVPEGNPKGLPRLLIGFASDIDAHRRANEFADMTRFMESTLSSIPSHIGVIDQQGAIILANDSWKSFAGGVCTLGVRPAVGTNYLDHLRSITGPDAAAAAQICETAVDLLHREFIPTPIEYQVAIGLNSLTFILTLRRFDLPTGICITLMHRDVTDARNTERALRDSEERWKFAIEGSGDAVFDWDLTANVVHRSTQFFKMLGLPAKQESTEFHDVWSFVHPDDLAKVQAKYVGLISAHQDLCAFEQRLQHKDGTWHWIMARCTVMRRDADGRATRILGVHTDITALKAVESQLRSQQTENRMLALVAEHTTNSVIITNGAGLIEWVNRGFESMTGYSRAEVTGRKPGAFL
jgi:PAS domain S-box-containing protein